MNTTPCQCCKKIEKKKHECTHEFCEPDCAKKKAEIQEAIPKELLPTNHIAPVLRKKLILGSKARIFGLVERSKDVEIINKVNVVTVPEKRPVFIIKK